MKTLFYIHGLCGTIFFDENVKELAYWHENDAFWRDEYHGDVVKLMGVNVIHIQDFISKEQKTEASAADEIDEYQDIYAGYDQWEDNIQGFLDNNKEELLALVEEYKPKKRSRRSS